MLPTENSLSRQGLPISKTMQGVSRNNFSEEAKFTPIHFNRILTVETPFKMQDVNRNEKLEKVSSLQYNNQKEALTEQRSHKDEFFNNKRIIG